MAILKILPRYFEDVTAGKKNFEVRNATDREFHVGDRVTLCEWDPKEQFTGRTHTVEISYVLYSADAPENLMVPGTAIFGWRDDREAVRLRDKVQSLIDKLSEEL